MEASGGLYRADSANILIETLRPARLSCWQWYRSNRRATTYIYVAIPRKEFHQENFLSRLRSLRLRVPEMLILHRNAGSLLDTYEDMLSSPSPKKSTHYASRSGIFWAEMDNPGKFLAWKAAFGKKLQSSRRSFPVWGCTHIYGLIRAVGMRVSPTVDPSKEGFHYVGRVCTKTMLA